MTERLLRLGERVLDFIEHISTNGMITVDRRYRQDLEDARAGIRRDLVDPVNARPFRPRIKPL